MLRKIKEWLKVMERTKRYAKTLNAVDHALTDFEDRKRGKMSDDCQELIEIIDNVLEIQNRRTKG